MGVTGLLKQLQSITNPVSLNKYAGLTVAVDAMCLLHKGIFASDPRALAMSQFYATAGNSNSNSSSSVKETWNTNDESMVRRLNFDSIDETKNKAKDLVKETEAVRQCVDYVIRQVHIMINQFNMDVILVIDGAPLPAKAGVNSERRRVRSHAFQKALEAETRNDSRNARRLFAQSCSISYDVRFELISRCRCSGISFIVAPYEADAQMARLAHACIVDLVITEDSDLLLYGCPRVLFKSDLQSGRGDEIQIMRDLALNDALSFQNWSHDMFVYMCILSGCDYCDGIPGVGLQMAHKLVRVYRTPSKILKALDNDRKLPHGFEDRFFLALKTFRHQRVYCTRTGVMDHLFPLEDRAVDSSTDQSWNFLGPFLSPDIVRGIASGAIHPDTKAPWKVQVENVTDKITDNGLQPVRNDDVHEHSNNFSFFSRKRNYESTKMGRSPLKTIVINNNHLQPRPSSIHHADTTDWINNRLFCGKPQSVPIHYDDYSSRLVGSAFRTLTRSNKNNNNNTSKRKNIVKSMLRLKKDYSSKPDVGSMPQANAAIDAANSIDIATATNFCNNRKVVAHEMAGDMSLKKSSDNGRSFFTIEPMGQCEDKNYNDPFWIERKPFSDKSFPPQCERDAENNKVDQGSGQNSGYLSDPQLSSVNAEDERRYFHKLAGWNSQDRNIVEKGSMTWSGKHSTHKGNTDDMFTMPDFGFMKALEQSLRR